MQRRMVTVTATVIVVCAAALAAVAMFSVATTDEAAAPVRLTAAVEQWRHDEPRHVLQVALTNGEPSPITIQQVQLVSPAFPNAAPTPKDTRLEPGRRVDMRLAYGELACDGLAEFTAGAAEVRVDVRLDDGSQRRVTATLPQPESTLDRIVRIECGARAVNAAIDVGFGSSWTSTTTANGEEVLQGSLVVRRTEGSDGEVGSVAVNRIAGTIIFQVRPAVAEQQPILQLAPEMSEATAPLVVSISRCDVHALLESKLSYLFPVWVSIDGAGPFRATYEPDDQTRALFDALVRRCVDGG